MQRSVLAVSEAKPTSDDDDYHVAEMISLVAVVVADNLCLFVSNAVNLIGYASTEKNLPKD
jgi:hypothetical protein